MATTLTVAGGDCFRLAMDQLGDACQFWRILAANPALTSAGIADPVLPGLVTLTIPAADASLTDGYPPQD